VRRSLTDGRSPRRLSPGLLVAIGTAVFIAGRIVDAVWHATHEEFETAADQLQAHTVVWVGTLVLLAAGAAARARGTRNTGYTVVLVGAISYLGVAAWHFWEHSQLRDPDLPHLLLVVTNIILFAGVVWAWAASLRRPDRPAWRQRRGA